MDCAIIKRAASEREALVVPASKALTHGGQRVHALTQVRLARNFYSTTLYLLGCPHLKATVCKVHTSSVCNTPHFKRRTECCVVRSSSYRNSILGVK